MEEVGLRGLLELVHLQEKFYVVASVGRAVRPADASVPPELVVEGGWLLAVGPGLLEPAAAELAVGCLAVALDGETAVAGLALPLAAVGAAEG